MGVRKSIFVKAALIKTQSGISKIEVYVSLTSQLDISVQTVKLAHFFTVVRGPGSFSLVPCHLRWLTHVHISTCGKDKEKERALLPIRRCLAVATRYCCLHPIGQNFIT